VLDGEVWEEFHADFPKSVAESEKKLRILFEVADDQEIEVSRSKGIVISRIPVEKTETISEVRRRIGQNLFRDAVLNNYDECCAVTQLNLRPLLIASHILPWATHPQNRLEIENGICLSRLHDAAFDSGLISFDDDLCLLISSVLRSALPKTVVEENFLTYEGQPLHLGIKAVSPSRAHLAFHRKNIFKFR
jgi:putative restriction endonuclease